MTNNKQLKTKIIIYLENWLATFLTKISEVFIVTRNAVSFSSVHDETMVQTALTIGGSTDKTRFVEIETFHRRVFPPFLNITHLGIFLLTLRSQ